jgi:hypothetical protein
MSAGFLPDLLTDVRRLNAIGDPLLYRIVLGVLLAHYGPDRIAECAPN